MKTTTKGADMTGFIPAPLYRVRYTNLATGRVAETVRLSHADAVEYHAAAERLTGLPAEIVADNGAAA